MCAILFNSAVVHIVDNYLYEISSLSRYLEMLDVFKSRSRVTLLVNSFLKLMGNNIFGNGIAKPPLNSILVQWSEGGGREVIAKDALLVYARKFSLSITLYVMCI